MVVSLSNLVARQGSQNSPTPRQSQFSGCDRAKEVQLILNRKLIRPNLTEIKEQVNSKPNRKKPAPPEQTNAENYYFIRQMNNKTPMVIQCKDGEEIRGIIEWYDKSCIKVHRNGAPNLLIYKDTIKYIFKDPAFDSDFDYEDK
jgi:host factor-I protein